LQGEVVVDGDSMIDGEEFEKDEMSDDWAEGAVEDGETVITA
jgi:hypothetical protein